MRRVDKKGIEHLCKNLAAVLLFSLPFPLALSPSFLGMRNENGKEKVPSYQEEEKEGFETGTGVDTGNRGIMD